MLGTSWECHKVREFALRPMGDFFTGVGPYFIPNRTREIIGLAEGVRIHTDQCVFEFREKVCLNIVSES